MGGPRARVNLNVLDEGGGKVALGKSKPSKPTAHDEERGSKFAGSDYQEAVEKA